MKRVIFTLLTLLSLPLFAPAQLISDGSLYSRYGLGERTTTLSSQAQGMGGAGVALSSPSYLSGGNPANWGNQLLTRFAAGYRFQGNRLTDKAGNHSTLGTSDIEYFHLAFPILDRHIGLGLSYQPYSRMAYRVEEEKTIPAVDSLAKTTYTTSYEGRGGIQHLDAGLGFKVGKNISFGGAVRVYTGQLETIQRTSFSDTANFTERLITENTRLYGLGGVFGVQFEKFGLGNDPNRAIYAGLAYTTPAEFTTRRTRILGEDDIVDTLGVTLNGTTRIPASFTGGLGMKVNEHLMAVADVMWEPWTSFSSTLKYGGYLPNVASATQFRDRLRIAGGVEYLPAGRDFRTSYFRRASYRAGFYWDQGNIQPKAGYFLDTKALTAGISLPTRKLGSQVDVNFELGVRGTTSNGLVRDVFFKTGVALNVGEKWFNRFKIQ